MRSETASSKRDNRHYRAYCNSPGGQRWHARRVSAPWSTGGRSSRRDIQGPLQGLLRTHGRPPARRGADAGHAAPAPRHLRRERPRPARPRAAAPHWLYHQLTVTGPAGPLAVFAEAARGSGVIPWQIDAGRIEEDVFNLAVSQPPAQRNLTVAGCRILARQFRERVELRQAQAAARIGRSRACPFDLQQLLPVPEAVLVLGPTHPAALAWLSAAWGATDRLRQVAERTPTPRRRRLQGHAAIGYGFFTAGETPRAAIDRVAAGWPDLRFALQPRPPD
jgi:hypothetical protein